MDRIEYNPTVNLKPVAGLLLVYKCFKPQLRETTSFPTCVQAGFQTLISEVGGQCVTTAPPWFLLKPIQSLLINSQEAVTFELLDPPSPQADVVTTAAVFTLSNQCCLAEGAVATGATLL